MIDYRIAKTIVEERLKKWPPAQVGKDELVITKSEEYEFGWFFSYDSKLFVETRNPLYALLGVGGYIVDREGGQVYVMGWEHSIEYYIDDFRKFKKGENYLVDWEKEHI